MSKKTKRSISTFAILLAVMLLVSIVTWIAAGKTYTCLLYTSDAADE